MKKKKKKRRRKLERGKKTKQNNAKPQAVRVFVCFGKKYSDWYGILKNKKIRITKHKVFILF